MKIKNRDTHTLLWLYRLSKGQRLRIFLLMVSNGLFSASFIWFALICRQLIDAAVAHNREVLIEQAVYLLGVVMLQLCMRIFCNSMLEFVKCRLDISMKQYVVDKMLKKDYQSISEYHSGELLNRLFSDVQVITDGITGMLPNLVNIVTRLLMAVGVMVIMDPMFTLIFLVSGVLIFFVTIFFRRKMKSLHKEVQQKQGIVRSFLQEMLESLLIVKVFGLEGYMKDEMRKRQEDYFGIQMKRRTFSIWANAGIHFVFRLGYLYALCWGAFGIYHRTLSYGSLTAMLQMVGQIQTPFSSLSGFLPQFYSILASSERLMELEQINDEVMEEPIEVHEVYNCLETIEFQQVQFSYGRNPVLIDSSFKVNKGDFVAITGLSGGGKSTMFLLMLGAYHPNGGKICIKLMRNGESDVVLPGTGSRRLFAYVPQGNYLFSGTVRENITMLKPSASDDEVWKALEYACADEFIRDIPDGLDTAVGEHGFGFSEGQVQRLAIARALLGGAPILLLDEATSALDEPTEAKVLQNIAELREKTCFIVTHRRAALSICNKILQIEDGRIRENNV